MNRRRIKRVYLVPIVYGIFSVLWIFFSDKIAFAVAPDQTRAALFSTVKGMAFVVLSTFLIYALLRVDERRQEKLLTEMAAVQNSFNLLFEGNPQPMWVYDNNTLQIQAANSATCLKYGYTLEEFLKLKITDLRKEEDIPALMRVLNDRKSEIRQSGPWRHVKKDGEALFVDVISHPLKLAGMDSTMVSIIDLTAHQKTLEELNAAQQERDAFASFGYTASHDLKAPLRAIAGYSEILLKEYKAHLDEEGQHLLQQVQVASTNMEKMIIDLLALSGITRKPLQLENVNMSEMIVEYEKILKMNEPDRNITLTIQPDMVVFADKGILKIAIQNLIQNAWKYSSETEKALIEAGSLINEEQERVFFIKDNGIGFDQSYANTVFEPFKRTQSSTKYEGFGIGLSIARKAIERHDGRIWVETETGKGATFFFTLREIN